MVFGILTWTDHGPPTYVAGCQLGCQEVVTWLTLHGTCCLEALTQTVWKKHQLTVVYANFHRIMFIAAAAAAVSSYVTRCVSLYHSGWDCMWYIAWRCVATMTDTIRSWSFVGLFTRLPTELQPDCSRRLHTAKRFVLVFFPLSSVV